MSDPQFFEPGRITRPGDPEGPIQPTPVATIDLDLLKLILQTRMSMEDLWQGDPRSQVHVDYDVRMQQVVFTFTREFASRKLENFEIVYPLNWWEGVKERFVPKWVANRVPRFKAKLMKHEFHWDAIYPDLPLPNQHKESFIRSWKWPIE